jgi:outer membrane protein OmpA-like peptidoglycan-associated protein
MTRGSALLVVALLSAGVASAEGTSEIGADHWLMPSTPLRVDVDATTERVQVRAQSQSATAFELVAVLPGGDTSRWTLEPNATGWWDAALPVVLPATSGRVELGLVPLTAEPELRVQLDVLVLDDAGIEQPGRLSSPRWEIDTGSYLVLTQTAFFVAVPTEAGGYVWRLGLEGLAGFQFQVSASASGLGPPLSGLSAPAPATTLSADYDVFLAPPDRPLSTSGSPNITELNADGSLVTWRSSHGGTAVLSVDVDGDGVAGTNADERLWVAPIDAGLGSLYFDGRDATGERLPPGDYLAELRVRTGEFHFVAFDVEYMRPGVRIHRVTETGLEPAAMRWDDSLVDDGSLGVVNTGPAGVSSGDASLPASAETAHGWGASLGDSGGPGDRAFLDTWVAGEEAAATMILRVPSLADGGQVDGGPSTSDAGPTGADAGGGAVLDGEDAGAASDDAGSSTDDAGFVGDAGVSEADAGAASGEAGFVDDDAGFVDDDAGFVDDDAGFVDDDAGAPDGDAGPRPSPQPWPLRDAGVTAVGDSDAGLADPGEWTRPAGAPAPRARGPASLQPGGKLYGGWSCRSIESSANAADVAFAFSWLGLLLLMRRRRRPSATSAAVVLLGVALGAAPATAFDAELASAPATTGPYLGLNARGDATSSFALRSVVGWALNPVVASPTDPRISHLFLASLGVGWSPLRTLTVELITPTHGSPGLAPRTLFRGVRLGDATLRARWEVLAAERWAVSLAPWARAPLWPDADVVGGALGAGAAVGGHAALSDWLRVDVDVGASVVGGDRSHAYGGLGAVWSPLPWCALPVELVARWYATPRADVGNPLPVELRASPTLRLGDLDVSALLGTGLTGGVGAPLLRVGASLRWAPGRAAARQQHHVRAKKLQARTDAELRLREIRTVGADGRALTATVEHDGRPCGPASSRVPCPRRAGTIVAHAAGHYPSSLRVDVDQGDLTLVLHRAEARFEVRRARVQLGLAVFFDTDRATLTKTGRERLTRLASALRYEPRRWTVLLRAHADHRGGDAYNQRLSEARAESVRRFLDEHGADAEVIVVALGDRRARESDDPTVLQRDRRVEVDARRAP